MILDLKQDAPYFYEAAMELNDEGNYIGALRFLRRALALAEQSSTSKDRCTETDILSIKTEIAATYSDMGLFEYSQKEFFKLLPDAGELADEIYFGIIKNFALLNMVNEAAYFLAEGIERGYLDPADGFNPLQLIEPSESEFKLLKNNDNQYMLDIAKQLIASPEKEYAKQILENMNEGSKQYCEAQTYLSLLNMSEGNAGDALINSENAINADANDINAMASKIMALDMLNRVEERDKVIDSLDAKEYSELKDLIKIALCMANVSNDELTQKYAKKVLELEPYDRDISLLYALSSFNLGDKITAKEMICNLLEIYAEDITLKYYAKAITFSEIGDKIKLITDIPSDVQRTIYETTEDWLVSKKTVKKVVELLKVNSEMQDNIRYVFQSNNIGMIIRVGAFLAQATEWHKFLRLLLLDTDFPIIAKKEILLNILKFAKNKKFFLSINNFVREFNPKIPKINANYIFEDAYFQVYCVLAFAEIDFDSKLNESYKKVFAALQNKVGLEENVLAAVIAFKSRANKIFFQKDFCAEIFGCDEQEFKSYLNLINEYARFNKNSRKENKKC